MWLPQFPQMFFFFPVNIVLNPCFLQGTRKRSAESEEGQAAAGQAQETRGECQQWWEPTAVTAPEALWPWRVGVASSTELLTSAKGSLKISYMEKEPVRV